MKEMKLESIYEKEITRHINPAVVVGELDSKHKEQEIGEYVFTPDIFQNIYLFLDAIVNKKEGKTGIWISGYYGSGKSHFIKYLFYCLNRETRSKAFEKLKESLKDAKMDAFSEVTLSNIQLLQNALDKLDVEEIIFNIDAVSGSTKNNETITQILLNQLNYTRGYNSSNSSVALLIEKHFDKAGLFDRFKEKVKEQLKEDWSEHKVRDLIRLKLSTIVDIACELDETIDKDSLYNSIRKDQSLTINELVAEFEEYVQTKDDSFRLIFLMDEVSQYIGRNTSLLLNLQTIVEEIGSKIGNKVWIVCTAQQDLRDLIDNTSNKSEDFGKIMGRFETRISLDSQDAAFITQKRILEKNQEGIVALNEFYKKYRADIQNQFLFDHDLYKNYSNVEGFYLAYPFIPYQFRLISDVFQSFSSVGFVGAGVKNTERSILGITHYTAAKQKDQELGYFISFDNFFNDQFNKNLTIQASSILTKAFQIEFDKDDTVFAQRVIKVLFMISNLADDKSINLPATVENITLLLINDITTVKIELQKEVQKVLDRLVEKNVVQASEGKYKFLDDDGIKVANAISAQSLSTNNRLTYFYEYFIQKFLQPEGRVSLGSRNIKAELAVDDKIMNQGGELKIRFAVMDGTDWTQQPLNTERNELLIGINQWYNNDSIFRRDFLDWCKTTKYLSDHRASATGTRIKTLNEFGSANEVKLKELQTRFEKAFGDIPFISAQQAMNASDISSTTPAQRYQDMVKHHVNSLYTKFSWSNDFAQSNAELQSEIEKGLKQATIDNELNLAEEEVNNRIKLLGNDAPLADIVKEFEKIPYGWKDLATIHIVFNLARKKHCSLHFQNEELELKDYFQHAINSRTREAIEIKAFKDLDKTAVEAFQNAVQRIFPDFSFPGATADIKEKIEKFKQYVGQALETSERYREDYGGFPFSKHLSAFHKIVNEISETRSDKKLIELVNDNTNGWAEARDLFTSAKDFIDNNFQEYEKIRDFEREENENVNYLGDAFQDDSQKLHEYFMQDDRPWDEYPVIRRIYKNLKKATKEKLDELKEEVVSIYQRIFKELDEKRKELKIDEPNLLPDEGYTIDRLRKLKSLTSLDLEKMKAGDFKLDYVRLLSEHAERRLVAEKRGSDTYGDKLHAVKISTSVIGNTIKSEEDVEKLISTLRKRLLTELEKNGKLFLE